MSMQRTGRAVTRRKADVAIRVHERSSGDIDRARALTCKVRRGQAGIARVPARTGPERFGCGGIRRKVVVEPTKAVELENELLPAPVRIQRTSTAKRNTRRTRWRLDHLRMRRCACGSQGKQDEDAQSHETFDYGTTIVSPGISSMFWLRFFPFDTSL